jgi:hypothetical protein
MIWKIVFFEKPDAIDKNVFSFIENVSNLFQTRLSSSNKINSRKFGFSLNYKIPTKNKLAKENPILLDKDKKEDSGILNQ